MGYLTPPPSVVKTFNLAAMGKPIALWKASEGGLVTVIAGTGAFPGLPGVDADICIVSVQPGQANVEQQMKDGLGVGGPDRANGQTYWIYDDKGAGQRTAAPTLPAAYARLVQSGRLRMASTRYEAARDTSTLTVMAPKP
ncbi:hypothetical protein BH11PSE2_BH11PSE2_14780 [soil metagenome]